MIGLLKDFGYVKVTKEHSHGFWCNFSEILNEMTISEVISQVIKKHSKVLSSVRSYKEVSKYYLANL